MESFPRRLTDREAEILEFMLSVDDPRLVPLGAQAANATVLGRYDDGCASIEFTVD